MGVWTDLSAGVSVAKVARKGTWTNDPKDPNYVKHWKTAGGLEQTISARPGTAVFGGIRSPVTVRHTTDGTIFVDTPSLVGVGPIGRSANTLLNAKATPRSYTAAQVTTVQTSAQRLTISAPGVRIKVRQDGHVGRPSQLSKWGQLKNTWSLLKG